MQIFTNEEILFTNEEMYLTKKGMFSIKKGRNYKKNLTCMPEILRFGFGDR